MRSNNGPESFDKYRRTCTELQVQFRPLPMNFPHGQGFAAKTRMNLDGKVRFPVARAIVIDPDSNGWRNESKIPEEHSGASSINSIP